MDESNMQMVHTLSQTMGEIFQPLIQNTTQTNQMMTAQMARIAEFMGMPTPVQYQNQVVEMRENAQQVNPVNPELVEPPREEPPRKQIPILKEEEPRMVLVNRNQNVDRVVNQVRRNNIAAEQFGSHGPENNGSKWPKYGFC